MTIVDIPTDVLSPVIASAPYPHYCATVLVEATGVVEKATLSMSAVDS